MINVLTILISCLIRTCDLRNTRGDPPALMHTIPERLTSDMITMRVSLNHRAGLSGDNRGASSLSLHDRETEPLRVHRLRKHINDVVPFIQIRWGDHTGGVPILVNNPHPIENPKVLSDSLKILTAFLMHTSMQSKQSVRLRMLIY